MSAILRGVICQARPILSQPHLQKATVVSGPPKVRISFTEKVTIGTLMTIAIVSPMGYIMANIKHYRNRPGTEE